MEDLGGVKRRVTQIMRGLEHHEGGLFGLKKRKSKEIYQCLETSAEHGPGSAPGAQPWDKEWEGTDPRNSTWTGDRTSSMGSVQALSRDQEEVEFPELSGHIPPALG